MVAAVAVIAAVVPVIAVVTGVTVATAAISHRIVHALLEPRDSLRDVVHLIGVEPISRCIAKPPFDAARFLAQALGGSAAYARIADAVLKRVDALLERAHLAVAVVEAVAVVAIAAVVTVVAVALLGLRIILRCGRAGGDESRTGGGGGKNKNTHHRPPLARKVMRGVWGSP